MIDMKMRILAYAISDLFFAVYLSLDMVGADSHQRFWRFLFVFASYLVLVALMEFILRRTNKGGLGRDSKK